jgi:YidC/Oxa1 family membrane protein insertase
LRETFTKKKTFNETSGVIKWVGLRRKYIAVLLNFNNNTTHKVVARPIIKEGEKKSITHTYKLSVINESYEKGSLDFDFVVLPLHHDQLKTYQQEYEKIVFSGYSWFFGADRWYPKLCGLVLYLLKKFYSFLPNYGIAIILLTLLVRGILLPLTLSQTKSMAKMQEHAPAIKEIKARNKGNPQKANKEVMAYYKEAGVNPMAQMMGCFPMFLQLPVFIALFNVLGRALELKEAPFFAWIADLSRPDVITEAIQVPYLFPMGLTVLPFFMAGTMYFQMKMTITDPNQKAMVYMMPGMLFLFSASFPSGLVLYWTVSNIFTIGQTWIFKSRKKKLTAAPKAKIPQKSPRKKKPKKR